MMKIGFLGSSQSWYFSDLQRATQRIESPKIELVPLSFAEISTGFVTDFGKWENKSGTVDLNELDAILVRTMAAATLEQVVYRMDVLGQLQLSGITILTSARCVEISVDKYRSLGLIKSVGIPVPPTAVCQDVGTALEFFDRFENDIVVKPIFGSEGRGIVRVTSLELAKQVFAALSETGRVLYLQKYLPHGQSDVRILTIGDKVFSMKRQAVRNWKTNLTQGGVAQRHRPSEIEIRIARQVCECVDAKIAGIDIIYQNGKPYVLEVNAVPGWKGISRVLNVDIATELLTFVTDEIVKNDSSAAKIENSAMPSAN